MTVDQLIDNFIETAGIYRDRPLEVEPDNREELDHLLQVHGAQELLQAWSEYLEANLRGDLDRFLREVEERLQPKEDSRHLSPDFRPTWREIEKARVEVSIPGMRRISEILRDPRQRAAWATGKQTRALAAERKSN